MTILAACISMAIRDALMTLLTVAEAKGRSVLAGTLDALGDIAGLITIVFGAGAVIQHGWTPATVAVVGAMTVTSFVTTMAATTVGRRMEQA